MKQDLETYLTGLKSRGDLYFYPNKGNAGDSLIACAAFELFKRLNIPFHRITDALFDARGKVVVYGGGGNLVAGRTEARQFIERHHATAKRLVVLPHTISGHEDLLQKLGSNVDLFAREEVSYEHVQQHAPNANLFLADDLAFGLDVPSVLAADLSRPYRHLPAKQLIRRDIALLREAVRRSLGSMRILNCFRTDKEQTEIRRPIGNMDLSKLFKSSSFSPEQGLLASHMVLRFLNRYDELRTKRLYLGIAGAWLGKSVKFYPGSYFRNEAVYYLARRGW